MRMTLHKQYKILCHMIIEKAKELKKMRLYDYRHIVKPYCTILSNKAITEQQLLTGFKRARIEIVK